MASFQRNALNDLIPLAFPRLLIAHRLVYKIGRTHPNFLFGRKKPEAIAQAAREAFGAHPHWRSSDEETRKVRAKVYGGILKHNPEPIDDDAKMQGMAKFVDEFFDFLKDQQV